MSKEPKKFYIGIDVGKASCGVACCDEDYKILKWNGKECWVSRLFDEAKTAKKRRMYRGSRRLIERKKKRVEYLQEVMGNKINSLDTEFFSRLTNSRLYTEKKKEKLKEKFPNFEEKNKILTKENNKLPSRGKYSLFNDSNYNDKNFFKDFPTIYHLREYLAQGRKDKFTDIRHIYLACEHIVKRRGFFSEKPVTESDGEPEFVEYFLKFKESWNEEFVNDKIEFSLEFENTSDCFKKNAEIKNILLDKNNKKADKQTKISKLINADKDSNVGKVLIFLFGKKVFLFPDGKEYDFSKDEETPHIELCNALKILVTLFADFSELHLKKGETISNIFVKKYDEFFNFRKDILTKYKGFFDGESYKIEGTKEEYTKLKKGENEFTEITYDEHKKYIKVVFKSPITVFNQNCGINSYYHHEELKKILENTDLLSCSEKEKICKIHSFKTPYYVGIIPSTKQSFLSILDEKRRKPWVVFKEGVNIQNEKIRPWNFENLIDLKETAKAFIKRMQKKCTYLLSEYVLPKESILLSKFLVYQTINGIELNETKNEEILKKIKPKLYEEWKKGNLNTTSAFKKGIIKAIDNPKFCEDSNISEKTISITNKGKENEDKILPSSPFKKLEKIFGESIYDETNTILISKAESLIEICTIMPTIEDAIEVFNKTYGEHVLSKDACKELKKVKFSGWGRFSKKLLELEVAKKGDKNNSKKIVSWIEDEVYLKDEDELRVFNFQVLNSRKFNTPEKIEKENKDFLAKPENKITTVSDFFNVFSYIPPFLRRSFNQAVKCVDEYKTLLEKDNIKLSKIFIETTREVSKSKGEEKESKIKQMEDVYKHAKNLDVSIWSDKIQKEWRSRENTKIGDKIYLYLTQNGKDIYNNEDSLVLDEIINNPDYCQIDHIFPQSLGFDNSFDNKGLTKKKENQIKKNEYPLKEEIIKKNKDWWNSLKKNNLISSKKYDLLTSNEPIEPREFLARDLNQVGWVVKLLQKYFEVSENSNGTKKYGVIDVIPVKPIYASLCRKQVFNWEKNRDSDCFHHAEDAYFNIICGDIINSNKWNFENILEIFKTSKEEGKVPKIIDESGKERLKITNALVYAIYKKTNEEKIKNNIASSLESGKIFVTVMPKFNNSAMNEVTANSSLKESKNKGFEKNLPLKKSLNIFPYGYYKTAFTMFWSILKIKEKIISFPIKCNLWSKYWNKYKITNMNGTINNDIKKTLISEIYNEENKEKIGKENVLYPELKNCEILGIENEEGLNNSKTTFCKFFLGGTKDDGNYITNANVTYLNKNCRDLIFLFGEKIKIEGELKKLRNGNRKQNMVANEENVLAKQKENELKKTEQKICQISLSSDNHILTSHEKFEKLCDILKNSLSKVFKDKYDNYSKTYDELKKCEEFNNCQKREIVSLYKDFKKSNSTKCLEKIIQLVNSNPQELSSFYDNLKTIKEKEFKEKYSKNYNNYNDEIKFKMLVDYAKVSSNAYDDNTKIGKTIDCFDAIIKQSETGLTEKIFFLRKTK